MKILHVLDHSLPYMSGYAFRSNSILSTQKEIGLSVVALTSPNHQGKELLEERDGICYYRSASLENNWFPRRLFIREALFILRLRRYLFEVARLEQPDLLHVHSPSLNGLAALSVVKHINIPLVYEVRALWEDAGVSHGTFNQSSIRYKMSRFLETRVLKSANAVTTICEGLRKEIISRGINPKRIYTVPNGVNTNMFTPKEKNCLLLNKYQLHGNLVLGFIGSFYKYEGLDNLLKAMPVIVNKNPRIRLLLVGGSEEEQSLHELSRELSLQEYVIFTGHVPHSSVIDYYSVIDIFIYPRLPMRITELVTPLKPLEAMAMAKVVLASNVGGNSELIQDGKSGFLFQAGDRVDMADKILSIAENAEIQQRIGDAARWEVIKNRQWGTIVSRYAEIYKKCLSPLEG